MTERTHSIEQPTEKLRAVSEVEPQDKNRSAEVLPLPDPARTFAEQEPEVLLALCVFGEARGECDAAQRAVAQVVRNRTRFPHAVFGSRRDADFTENLRNVILQPKQFSCFLTAGPHRDKLLHPLDG